MTKQDEVWRCRKCGAVLGYFDGKDFLRIKYKDLVVYISSETKNSITRVERICRGCAAWNVTFLQGKKEGNTPLKEQLERVKDKIKVVES
ncbi:hypothetical protein DRO31_04440 [Candidatus Bathyarchaeota archaeon]|nr:MAG: hypothetical protein DRO31_04440 [Candidatus Bathyarchaeota archaeon]